MKRCRREIKQIDHRIKAIEEPYQKEYKRLDRYQNEWMRLQGKDIIYKVDVELDQIITYFRVSLANIAAYFLKKFLHMGPLCFSTLMQSILLLDGEVEETEKMRKVILKRNPKDPMIMEQLELALAQINNLSLHTLTGKVYQFLLS